MSMRFDDYMGFNGPPGTWPEEKGSDVQRPTPPLMLSQSPCRLTVEIVPARPERLVDVDLPAGSTWDDYSRAVEEAAGVTLGPEPGQWLLSMHWDRP